MQRPPTTRDNQAILHNCTFLKQKKIFQSYKKQKKSGKTKQEVPLIGFFSSANMAVCTHKIRKMKGSSQYLHLKNWRVQCKNMEKQGYIYWSKEVDQKLHKAQVCSYPTYGEVFSLLMQYWYCFMILSEWETRICNVFKVLWFIHNKRGAKFCERKAYVRSSNLRL